MRESKAYEQVVDNLVYIATCIILKSIDRVDEQNSILDVINDKQVPEWAILDNIVDVSATTYNIPKQAILADYTERLTRVMLTRLYESATP